MKMRQIWGEQLVGEWQGVHGRAPDSPPATPSVTPRFPNNVNNTNKSEYST